MKPGRLVPILMIALFLAGTSAANATLITGRFAGAVQNSTAAEFINGAPLFGNFWLDTAHFYTDFDGSPPSRVGHYIGDTTDFNFRFTTPWTGDEHTQSYAYVNLDLYDDGVTQKIVIVEYYHGDGGSFQLAAPSGTLFSQIDDLSTLHAAPLDLARSSITFNQRWSAFDVKLSRLALSDDLSVPEPSTTALLLAALGMLIVRGGRRFSV